MSDSEGHHQRAQSELIGIILLFSLVITVSLTVVVVGGSALGDVQDNTMTESAENTMLELQSKAAQAGSSTATVQEVSFAQSQGARPASDRADGIGSRAENVGDITVDETDGEMTVEVLNSSGKVQVGPKTIQMGKILYQRGGQNVGYQGGGVFRRNPGSSSSAVVSPPNFQYQYQNGIPTLSMPISSVSGQAANDKFSLRRTGSSQVFPSGSVGNPIESGQKVRITVQSEFYRGWGEVFSDRTDGSVVYNDAANEVVLTLNGPDVNTGPANVGGLVTSDVSSLKVQNHAHVDSYDSSGHTASTTGISVNDEAPVFVRGAFDPGNHVYIDGHVHATGPITYDSSNGNQEDNRIAGEAVFGGTPGDSDPSWVRGKLEFRDVFSTKDDLSVEGSGNNKPDKRVLFEDDVYVGGDILDEKSGKVEDGKKFRNVRIQGNLYVQGDVDISDDADVKIDGDIIGGGSVDVGSQVSYNSITENADPPDTLDPNLPRSPNVGDDIGGMESATDYSADAPPNAADIENWGDCVPECTLTAGTHRVEGITLGKSGNTQGKLILDTSGGPVKVFVEGDAQNGNSLHMGQGTEIVVQGPNKATLYAESGVLTEKNSEIRTEPVPYRAPNFELKVDPDSVVDMNSNGGSPTSVTGLINGSHPSNGAVMELDKYARVYGAVLGDPTASNDEGIRNDVQIHFDEALLGSGGSDSRITGSADDVAFLRIGQTELRAED